ncbi:hypothetical protein C3495_04300 [Clostridiaceae bacterium 14S0207]|nr:hypothetical protein C3495_04300 [Clostridiaceae bacterium 14S0207]
MDYVIVGILVVISLYILGNHVRKQIKGEGCSSCSGNCSGCSKCNNNYITIDTTSLKKNNVPENFDKNEK